MSWSAVQAADSYRVFRDGALIAQTSEPFWMDDGATAAAMPAPGRVTASQGSSTGGVELGWEVPPPALQTTHTYSVKAVNAVGEGASSPSDDGARGAAERVGYEVSTDEGRTWLGVGTGNTWLDTHAPLGTANPGSIVASRGARFDRVSLSCLHASITAAPAQSYLVRAVTADGPGISAAGVTGFRGTGAVAYRWERSQSDSEGGFVALEGAAASIDDLDAPVSGEERFYRCIVSAEGATSAVSAPERGFRAALPVVETAAARQVTQTGVEARGTLVGPGAPAAIARGFCVGLQASPGLGDGGADCDGPLAAPAIGTFATVFGGLAPGMRYHVRAWAQHPSGAVVYGENFTFTTVPETPGDLYASQGTSRTSVEVIWPRVVGANAYRVFRDGELIGETADTSWEDLGAAPGGVPRAPTGLTTTSYADRVQLSWVAPAPANGTVHSYAVVAVNEQGESEPLGDVQGFRGAFPVSSYTIHRGGEVVGSSPVTSYPDTTAAAPGVPPAPTASANQGTRPEKVVVSWSRLQPTAAPVAAYSVSATNTAGEGPPTSNVFGSRLATPVMNYEISVDGGATFVDVGDTTSYDDSTAPAGSLVHGAAVAGKGAGYGVPLNCTSGGVAGAMKTYVVRAVNASGAGGTSPVSGYRAAPALTYRWERSSGDAADGWSPLLGGSSRDWTDPWAPPSGAARWYRCIVVADGFPELTSAPDRGWRLEGPREDLWVTNGTVRAALVDAGRLYVGGDFTLVGPPTGNLVALDPGTGNVQSGAPFVDGAVSAIVSDGAGGAFLAGWFSSVGGVARIGLAHVFADGSVDPAWHPVPDGTVSSIVKEGQTLYVGGSFSAIDGKPRRALAAIDTTTGEILPWNPISSGSVDALVAADGVVYVGGRFLNPTYLDYAAAAAIDGATGTSLWTVWSSSPVRSLALANDAVIVAGSFSSLRGESRRGLAMLSRSSGALLPWDASLNGSGSSVSIHDGHAYVAGSFTKVGSQTRNGLAAISLTTGSANSWDPKPTGAISSITFLGDDVYLSGSFTALDGQQRFGLGVVDATTGVADAWAPVMLGWSQAVFPSGGSVWVGGSFQSAGGVTRNRLAAFDLTTGRALPWNPNVNGAVHAIVKSGNAVYFGGEFSSVSGLARANLAAVGPDSGVPTSWNPSASDSVFALATAGSHIYAGGSFKSIGGAARMCLATLDNSTGQAVPSGAPMFSSSSTEPVYALAVENNRLFIGSGGYMYAGDGLYYAAAMTLTGQPAPWRPEPDKAVRAIAVDGDTVFLGGEFAKLGGQVRQKVAAVNLTSGAALAWNPGASGPVRAVAVHDGRVFLGGEFSTVGGTARSQSAAVDRTSGAVLSWDAAASGAPHAFAFDDSFVYLGGAYEFIAGQFRRGVAALPK